MRPSKGDSLLVAVGAGVSGASGFAFAWILARATGPSGSAVVLTVTTWFTLLLTVGKLGLDTTLVREGGRIRVGGPGAGPTSLLRWTLLPVTAGVALAGMAVAAAAQPIGQWILSESPVPMTSLVVTGGLLLPLGVYTVTQLAYSRGLGSIREYVAIEQVVKPGLRLLGSGLLLIAGLSGALAFGWVWFLPVIVAATLTVWVAARRHPSHPEPRPSGPPPRASGECSRVWRYAGPRAASQIVDIVNTSFGTMVLGVLATAADTGAFAIALRVVFAGQLVFQAVRLLLAPSFAALLARGRIHDAQQVFSAGTSLIVALAWPGFLLCLILPDLVLGFFGAGFESAAPVLQVLSLAGLLLAVVGNQGSVVLMSGRSGSALAAIAAGLTVNVAVTMALLNVWGATAAAAGWTASVLVEGLWLARALSAEGLHPLPETAFLMAVRVTAVVAIPLLIARFFWPSAPWIAAAVVLVGVVAAPAVIVPAARRQFQILTEEDQALPEGATHDSPHPV